MKTTRGKQQQNLFTVKEEGVIKHEDLQLPLSVCNLSLLLKANSKFYNQEN